MYYIDIERTENAQTHHHEHHKHPNMREGDIVLHYRRAISLPWGMQPYDEDHLTCRGLAWRALHLGSGAQPPSDMCTLLVEEHWTCVPSLVT